VADAPEAQAGGPAPAPDDGGAVRWFGRFVSALNAVGTVGILGLMVLINTDIAGRALFGAPISGVPEMVSLSIVGIVFLQLPHTLRVGRVTRSDALMRVLQRRAPRLLEWLEVVYNLIGAALVAVLFHASLPLFVRAWTDNVFEGAEGDFTAPVWPVKLIILIGTAALATQFAINVWRHARQAVRAKGGPP
jgi:TRAP-type C4-dicarboxylate transport system permease small subunit